MVEEELTVVELRDDFYRDHFRKVIWIIASLCIAIAFLVAVSIYLYINKPPPVTFTVDNEWRVQPPVPLEQPYLSTPDLLQWISNVIQNVFVYDFNHYDEQLQTATPYFTTDGWKVFLNQLNIYANYNNIQANKMFIRCVPTGAPYILNQGLLSGRYAWWVQMPIRLDYAGYNRSSTQNLTLQLLVVRVSTLNNLTGVGIENVIVTKGAGNQPIGTESNR